MKFDTPLLRGRLLRRYKRFLADVELESGETITAHTPNPGSMLTCSTPGSAACVSISDNPHRKLKHTWELVRSGGRWVGVNTLLANRLAEEAIAAGRITSLAGYGSLRREVKYGENSRIDFLLEDAARAPRYVEVKNVTMGRDGLAGFPDSVSARAAKHMGELAAQVRAGHGATVMFVVQRMDCEALAPADDIDPAYGRALRQAVEAGVEVLAYQARISPKEIRLVEPMDVRL